MFLTFIEQSYIKCFSEPSCEKMETFAKVLYFSDARSEEKGLK